MDSGVYKITNKHNGKIYIGSSTEIDRRWFDHISKLKGGNHGNIYLQRAWDKYGESAFTFEVLEYVNGSQELILEREQLWMDETECYNNTIGYNMCEYAGTTRGRKHRKETKEKMSKSRSGEKHHFYGKSFSDEHRRKLGESRSGEKHYNWGRKFSNETKENISKTLAGRELSDEHKESLRQAHTGKKHTPEHIEKRASKLRGREYGEHSEERKKKISKSRKGKGATKLDESKVREIKRLLNDKYKNVELARMFDVSPELISAIKNGRKWGHVEI